MKPRFPEPDIQKWASRYQVTPEEVEVIGLASLIREQFKFGQAGKTVRARFWGRGFF